MTPTSVPGVSEGQVLGGKYRIVRILGAGGMGVVAEAHHLQLDERVAIKFLLEQALANREAVARFGREARAAVKIKSEHVARVIDVGTLDNGAPFIVMEFLQGEDLAHRVRTQGPLGLRETVDFVLQACEAIAEAHALGIVHRDLKPANLFLARRPGGVPIVKVLDFGISKITSRGSNDDLNMTKTTDIMGSPNYMSPEQMVSSRDVDARTDIWSLGVILHELLTNSFPFQGESVPQLCAMILQTPPLPVRSARPDVPEGLEMVVGRCLQKDRTQRFSNVAELATALLPFGSPRARLSAERIHQVLAEAAEAMPQSAESSGQTVFVPQGSSPFAPPSKSARSFQTDLSFGSPRGHSRRSRPLRVMAAIAGIAVAAAGIVVMLVARGRTPTEVGQVVAPAASALTPEPRAVERQPVAQVEKPAATPEPEVAPEAGSPDIPFFPVGAPPGPRAVPASPVAGPKRPAAKPQAPAPKPREERPAQPSGDDLGGRL